MYDWIKKTWGSLKLYWQHVVLVIGVATWCIWVTGKIDTFDNALAAWEKLGYFLIGLAFGYGIMRLFETGQKNGNGKDKPPIP